MEREKEREREEKKGQLKFYNKRQRVGKQDPAQTDKEKNLSSSTSASGDVIFIIPGVVFIMLLVEIGCKLFTIVMTGGIPLLLLLLLFIFIVVGNACAIGCCGIVIIG